MPVTICNTMLDPLTEEAFLRALIDVGDLVDRAAAIVGRALDRLALLVVLCAGQLLRLLKVDLRQRPLLLGGRELIEALRGRVDGIVQPVEVCG